MDEDDASVGAEMWREANDAEGVSDGADEGEDDECDALVAVAASSAVTEGGSCGIWRSVWMRVPSGNSASENGMREASVGVRDSAPFLFFSSLDAESDGPG